MITSALTKCSRVYQQGRRFAGNYLWLLNFLFHQTWFRFLKVVGLNIVGAACQVASVVLLVMGIRRMESDTPTGVGFVDHLLGDPVTRILFLGSTIFVFLILDACVAYLFAIKMRALTRWVHQHIVSTLLKTYSQSTSLTHRTLPDSAAVSMQTITRDSLHVSNAFEALVRMTEPGIRAFVAVCLLFWIDSWLACLVVISLLLFAPVLHFVGSSTHRNTQTFFSSTASEMAQGLQKTLVQVRQISYVDDPVRTEAIDQAYWEKPQVQNYFDRFDTFRLAQFRSRFYASLVKTISLVLAFGGGAYLVVNGRLSWPVVAGFLVAGREAVTRFQAVSTSVTRLTIFYGGVIRFRSICDPKFSKSIASDSTQNHESETKESHETSSNLTITSTEKWPDGDSELVLEPGSVAAYLSEFPLDRANIGNLTAPLRTYFPHSDQEWSRNVGFVGGTAMIACGSLQDHLWGNRHTPEIEQQFVELLQALELDEEFSKLDRGVSTKASPELWTTFSRPLQTFLLMFPLFHDDNLVVFLDSPLFASVPRLLVERMFEEFPKTRVFIALKKPPQCPNWCDLAIVTHQEEVLGIGNRDWLMESKHRWAEIEAEQAPAGDSISETELLDVI